MVKHSGFSSVNVEDSHNNLETSSVIAKLNRNKRQNTTDACNIVIIMIIWTGRTYARAVVILSVRLSVLCHTRGL